MPELLVLFLGMYLLYQWVQGYSLLFFLLDLYWCLWYSWTWVLCRVWDHMHSSTSQHPVWPAPFDEDAFFFSIVWFCFLCQRSRMWVYLWVFNDDSTLLNRLMSVKGIWGGKFDFLCSLTSFTFSLWGNVGPWPSNFQSPKTMGKYVSVHYKSSGLQFSIVAVQYGLKQPLWSGVTLMCPDLSTSI